MKRLVLLLCGTAAAIAILVALRAQARPGANNPIAGAPGPTPQLSSRSSAPVSSSGSASPGSYSSGTATGPAVHTFWGQVQVRVNVAHGRIVKVTAVVLPHGNQMDLRISRPAARTLEREVIAAQSAQVDMVSGATYTSQGYLRSLQSAIDRLS